ncbi:hypothetical protein H5410_014993 [Solanum commersonii]|uniref:Uncharacterized protein n=1 Tax=Solanum commersonii TaxID=4109 RepID=A0A9J5ZSI0_SOLCO|nr:hypothetical protein H5410_014993 [Solanum commersonii]
MIPSYNSQRVFIVFKKNLCYSGSFGEVSRDHRILAIHRLLLSLPFDPFPSGLCVMEQRAECVPSAIRQTQNTHAKNNYVLKDSSCDTPLPKIFMLAILATCASSSSTKGI